MIESSSEVEGKKSLVYRPGELCPDLCGLSGGEINPDAELKNQKNTREGNFEVVEEYVKRLKDKWDEDFKQAKDKEQVKSKEQVKKPEYVAPPAGDEALEVGSGYIARAMKEEQQNLAVVSVSVESSSKQFEELSRDIQTFNAFIEILDKNPEIKQLLQNFNQQFKAIQANQDTRSKTTVLFSRIFLRKTEVQLEKQAQKAQLQQLVKNIKNKLDNLTDITSEEKTAITRISKKLTTAAEHTSHSNKTIKYLFNNMSFYENKVLKKQDENTFVLYNKTTDNTEIPIVKITKTQETTKTTVQITLEDTAALGNEGDQYLYQMIAYAKKCNINEHKKFNINDCEANPLAAMKLFIFGIGLGFNPQLNAATKDSIAAYIAAMLPGETNSKDAALVEMYKEFSSVNVTSLDVATRSRLISQIKTWEKMAYDNVDDQKRSASVMKV